MYEVRYVLINYFTKLEHICRAALEAVCYQSRAILEAMDKNAQTPLLSLKVNCGMSNSDLCMQIQADVLGIEVDRPLMRETTALGSVIAASMSAGIWKSCDDLSAINENGRTQLKSQITNKKREKMYYEWKEAVKRSLGWASSINLAENLETI